MNKVQRIQTFTRTLCSFYARRTCVPITQRFSTDSNSVEEKKVPHVKNDVEPLGQVVSENANAPDVDQSTIDSDDPDDSFLFTSEGYYIPENPTEPEKPKTFTHLLRRSAFINMGDPKEKHVIGTIFRVVDDDLYIDFDWKFHCVCQRPQKNQEKFIRGATVRLLIRNLELSTRFLGATRDITLCEADCSLLGIYDR